MKDDVIFNKAININCSLIKITGHDAEKFLQGQLTCDMREVTTTQSRLGAYCNHKGRVLATFRIFIWQQAYYLILPQTMSENVIQQLRKYAIFSKVNLEKIEIMHGIGIYGTDAETLLKPYMKHVPTTVDEVAQTADLVMIRVPDELPRFEIYTNQETAARLLEELGKHAQTKNANTWQLLNIRAGIATVYPATSEQFTPHMLNLHTVNAVSFTKGCYVGQEVIARTHYLGKSKRTLQYLVIHSVNALKPGDKLLDDNQQDIGIIVNAVRTGQEKQELLAVTSISPA